MEVRFFRMSVLPIIIGADQKILRTKTKLVPKVTKEIKKLLKDMTATMKNADGVGLAAPQVGLSYRICIAMIEDKLTALINPKITKRSKEMEFDQEGCLSLPEVWVQVPRAVEITVKYTDQNGKEQERKLSHFSARVVQHEVDHLDGVLIVDYIEKTKTQETRDNTDVL